MNPKKKNTIITTIGLFLLILGFLLLPSPYTLTLAIPVFFIGLFIIWTTKQSNNFKMLCAVMPIILFFPYSQLTSNLYKNSLRPETKIDLIIDENFVGKIIIINNLNCSKSHEIGKRTQIIVPDNGITHYNGKPKISSILTRVIERSKAGETKELNWHKLDEGEKGVTMGGHNGIVVEGKSYKVNVIEIGTEFSWEIGISSLEDEITKYIKDCKSEDY